MKKYLFFLFIIALLQSCYKRDSIVISSGKLKETISTAKTQKYFYSNDLLSRIDSYDSSKVISEVAIFEYTNGKLKEIKSTNYNTALEYVDSYRTNITQSSSTFYNNSNVSVPVTQNSNIYTSVFYNQNFNIQKVIKTDFNISIPIDSVKNYYYTKYDYNLNKYVTDSSRISYEITKSDFQKDSLIYSNFNSQGKPTKITTYSTLAQNGKNYKITLKSTSTISYNSYNEFDKSETVTSNNKILTEQVVYSTYLNPFPVLNSNPETAYKNSKYLPLYKKTPYYDGSNNLIMNENGYKDIKVDDKGVVIKATYFTNNYINNILQNSTSETIDFKYY